MVLEPVHSDWSTLKPVMASDAGCSKRSSNDTAVKLRVVVTGMLKVSPGLRVLTGSWPTTVLAPLLRLNACRGYVGTVPSSCSAPDPSSSP